MRSAVPLPQRRQSREACVVADRFPAVNVLDPGGVGGHGLGADTVDEPVVPWLRPPVP